MHILSLPSLLCWPEALPGAAEGREFNPPCSVSWLCSHPFPTVAPANVSPCNKSPDVYARSSLAAFLPLKSCHSLHWANFHGNMSKKIQSLNMGCDECRIIVSGSSIIGANGGSDGQARAASWGAPANMTARCLGSLSVKAALEEEGSAEHHVAPRRSGSSFAFYERPSPVDHDMPVWTSHLNKQLPNLHSEPRDEFSIQP